jgi:hypothetical protein
MAFFSLPSAPPVLSGFFFFFFPAPVVVPHAIYSHALAAKAGAVGKKKHNTTQSEHLVNVFRFDVRWIFFLSLPTYRLMMV